MMLYPTITDTRAVIDLSGTWKFKIDNEKGEISAGKPLQSADLIAVPASYNDQFPSDEIRRHTGFMWYEREIEVPKFLGGQRTVLRFGSATHEAWVYLNGEEITHHKGGFTPFEVAIENKLQLGKNLLQVKVSNILDYTTLPVGNYSEKKDEEGNLIRKVDENFDFFNYAGLQRPVKIYTTPQTHIEDITVCADVDHENESATINASAKVEGDYDTIQFVLIDEEGNEVNKVTGETIKFSITHPHLWQPLNSYLYRLKVNVIKSDQTIDTYTEPFGIRSVEVKDGKFLINNEPFYFKGFGKHEDSYGNGRGFNPVFNVLDIKLMKKMGANSFRTSHYPYSEEMMRLCDREGIVVIDETPAVGLFTSFGFDNLDVLDKDRLFNHSTWHDLNTHEAHEQVIHEMLARDKNHACVVMWSIANEAANFANGAYEYFAPLYQIFRDNDPQKRPCTTISIMMTQPNTDLTAELADVICLNRYNGWYIQLGDLKEAERIIRRELADWESKYPDKPIMFTEYGTDTVAGMHSAYNEPFSEEYQTNYYEMNSRVFDDYTHFVGEQLWNFADFQTKFGIQRVQGNKKGIFTRSREPKSVVGYLSKRWNAIPNFNYKK